jgi:hypothetical protein
MHNRDFEEFWWQLQHRLRSAPAAPGGAVEVPNWTVLKGYLGDTMQVVAVRGETIELVSPNARNLVVVQKAHFRAVWEIWSLYTDGQVSRGEIDAMTHYSKYIISILHWMDTKSE